MILAQKALVVQSGKVSRVQRKLCLLFKAQDGIPNWDAIEKCLKDWKPDVIVVGLPLNMDGTEQDLTLRAKKFANRLNGRFGIKVELQDERLTTVSARDEIFQRGGYRALNKGKVDGNFCLLDFRKLV